MTISAGLADRVVSGIKDQILAGDLAPGAKLPSESDLVEAYAVSPAVNRADNDGPELIAPAPAEQPPAAEADAGAERKKKPRIDERQGSLF